MSDVVRQVALHRATAERYLSYALSVITSRALPDVRDGLKPVQRRILYAMYNDMSLVTSGRYRKCAAVVGEVMGKYHPHGDSSIYEALVRMAQDFSLRAPFVDGQGNFGSLDGDPAAAMRYTECRLRPIAEEMISEIRKATVDFRPNYDGQRSEPEVLPAQFPQLLVNGCEGIAVGMATRVPPHNLGEVIDAAIALSEDRSLTVRDLMQHIKGPDFPTGGKLVASDRDIANVYETGQGTLKIRATYSIEKEGKRQKIVIDSIPYGQNKAKLVESIGEEVRTKRLPHVLDVRDESTDLVRIVLEIKQDISPEMVMAYLFKRTQLQSNWPVNLTALVPATQTAAQAGDLSAEAPETAAIAAGDDEVLSAVPTPARLDLKEILGHWLDFRLATMRRRYRFDLEELKQRIHILDGFRRLFDVLDEIIAIIRASEGKKDAATQLIERFSFSEAQTEAILEMRLYKLAKLEIHAILEELTERQEEAQRIEQILANERKLWNELRKELREIRRHYATARLTSVGPEEKAVTFDEEAFIVDEDAVVVLTRDGWLKRQVSYTGLHKIRVREGDEVSYAFKASTRSLVTFFTTHGVAYTTRVDAIQQTTGYGDPLQAMFAFADGERVVALVSHDPRNRPPTEPVPAVPEGEDPPPPPPYAAAITSGGRGLRFSLASHEEASNRTGRRYAKLDEGDFVFAVHVTQAPSTLVCLATRLGRALVLPCTELPVLKAVGKGVVAIKMRLEDAVMAVSLANSPEEGPTVVTSLGRELVINEKTFRPAERGGLGNVVIRRGTIDVWKRPGPSLWGLVEPPPKASGKDEPTDELSRDPSEESRPETTTATPPGSEA